MKLKMPSPEDAEPMATTAMTEEPAVLAVNADGIPQELKNTPQWLVWKLCHRDDKWTKVPFNPATGAEASSTNPNAWSSFNEAFGEYTLARNRWDGIGFAFSKDDPFVGVDLDRCRDATTGKIQPWSVRQQADFAGSVPDPSRIIASLGTFAEVSPSGTGYKLIGRGATQGRRCRKGSFEHYDNGRYFTVTGHLLPGSPSTVEACNGTLRKLYDAVFGQEKERPFVATSETTATLIGTPGPTDEQLLALATNVKNGDKFRRLMDGVTDGYASRSEVDAALACILAFWTRDTQQIERLMRQSKLGREKWNRDDYLPRTIASAIETVREFYRWPVENESDLPAIDASCEDLPRITRQVWGALRKANTPPRLFRHGGRIVRAERGDQDELILREVNIDRMRFELTQAASWFRWKKTGKDTSKKAATPSDKVVRNVLAMPDIDLPRLTRIVEAPVFGPDGSLQTERGYHAGSRTYYAPASGFGMPPVAEVPTREDVARAVDLLANELIGDFPFVGDAEKAHALSALLLPFVHDLIDSCSPFHLIEKPSPGTGATLLADLLACPAIGRPISAMTEGRDEDEWRKRITAKLRTGAAFILIDNLKNRLDSASVSSAITSPMWEDRILGASEMVKLPVQCVWLATGNNPAVSSEIARRTVRIRLDAKRDQPWRREGFHHPDIRIWARQNRGHLTWAALTLIRAWLAEGRPKFGVRLGMFESWSETIGGILDVAGVPGFLGNLDEFYQESDAEGNATRAFITAWWHRHKDRDVGVKDLWQLIDRTDFDLLLGDGSDRSQRTRLGKNLARLRDRIFRIEANETADAEAEHQTQGSHRNVQVKRAATRHRAQLWRLRMLDNKA